MAELILDIINRARTFSIANWNYRSLDAYNPYALASVGYECTALNILECDICHNKVAFTDEHGEEREEDEVRG
jgi:hypothetical protein